MVLLALLCTTICKYENQYCQCGKLRASNLDHIHIQNLLRLGKGICSSYLILCKLNSNLQRQFLFSWGVSQASLMPVSYIYWVSAFPSEKQLLVLPVH